MAQGLALVGQEDFAAGILRSSARDSEPGVGVVAARNGLFDDDGDVYRRGGDALLIPNPVNGPVTLLWSGFLNNNPRTIVATATKTYSLSALGVLTEIKATGVPRPVLNAVVGERLWLPGGTVWDGSAAAGSWTVAGMNVQHVCAVADRLVVSEGNKIAFSAPIPNAATALTFDPTDYHKLPDGVMVTGMMAIRDTCLVFSSFGVWAIGNMSFDLTDADGNVQQTLTRQLPELSLLHEAGLAEWAGKIVVPATDRVFLLDTISSPIPISDSVSRLYTKHVTAGLKPGGAKVYGNHYFLPFLRDNNSVAATLVCRLNRPVRGRQIYYPWSTMTGHAGSMTCFDVRLIEQRPGLSGGHFDGHLVNLTDIFNQGVHPSDVGGPHEFAVEMRDLITGNGQPNHVRLMRVWATIKGLPDDASWEAAYSTGSLTQTYRDLLAGSDRTGHTYQQVKDAFDDYEQALRGGLNSAVISEDEPDRFWYEAGQRTGNNDVDPLRFNFKRAVRTRYIRGWIGITQPCEQFTIHKIEFGVRPATHQR